VKEKGKKDETRALRERCLRSRKRGEILARVASKGATGGGKNQKHRKMKSIRVGRKGGERHKTCVGLYYYSKEGMEKKRGARPPSTSFKGEKKKNWARYVGDQRKRKKKGGGGKGGSPIEAFIALKNGREERERKKLAVFGYHIIKKKKRGDRRTPGVLEAGGGGAKRGVPRARIKGGGGRDCPRGGKKAPRSMKVRRRARPTKGQAATCQLMKKERKRLTPAPERKKRRRLAGKKTCTRFGKGGREDRAFGGAGKGEEAGTREFAHGGLSSNVRKKKERPDYRGGRASTAASILEDMRDPLTTGREGGVVGPGRARIVAPGGEKESLRGSVFDWWAPEGGKREGVSRQSISPTQLAQKKKKGAATGCLVAASAEKKKLILCPEGDGKRVS